MVFENSKIVNFGRVFENLKLVLPDRSVSIGQKLVGNANIEIFQCDILSSFQTVCMYTPNPEKMSKLIFLMLHWIFIFSFLFFFCWFGASWSTKQSLILRFHAHFGAGEKSVLTHLILRIAFAN